MIKDRRNPSLRIVTIRAGSLPRLCKLACVRVFVTIRANLRCALELHLLGSHRYLVTVAALDHAMGAKQRKFRFRMIESADVRPGPRVVASFAAERRTVRPELRHTIFELAMVNIFMTTCTGHVFENKGQDLIGSACGTNFVAVRTSNSRVRSGQRVARFPMHRQRESRLVKILNGVAVLALVLIRGGGELAVVRIFVAIRASRELHLVNRVLPCGQMTLVALYFCVLSFQRIL